MRITSSWYNYPRAILGSAEKRLVEWLASNVRPGETWIDVGAHYGYTALALCEYVGKIGRVIAFEPNLCTAGCLFQTREANGLTQLVVVPFGLGDVPALSLCPTRPEYLGMTRFYGRSATGLDPGNRGWDAYVIAFDRVWPVLCSGNVEVSGIKVDVQGDEAYVLRGMADTLRSQRPKLVVEYHRNADLDEVLDALDAAGYSRNGRDIDAPSPVESSDLAHGHNYEFRPS
jgi:FkbM family methyltransferase